MLQRNTLRYTRIAVAFLYQGNFSTDIKTKHDDGHDIDIEKKINDLSNSEKLDRLQPIFPDHSFPPPAGKETWGKLFTRKRKDEALLAKLRKENREQPPKNQVEKFEHLQKLKPLIKEYKTFNLGHFFEHDRKGNYDVVEDISYMEVVKNFYTNLPDEFMKFKGEFQTALSLNDTEKLIIEHGDFDILYKLDSEEAITDWVTTCDSDHNEGFSSVNLALGPNKKALFQGYICLDPPKDGIHSYAGIAAMRSPWIIKSFGRFAVHDWSRFTHLLMRVRGDGRPYIIHIMPYRYFDISWNDGYQYILYTKGGPYWQTVKIPFAAFFFVHKGCIQDTQCHIKGELDNIESIAITAGNFEGPFKLEIDYIGLVKDLTDNELIRYEEYECPSGYALEN